MKEIGNYNTINQANETANRRILVKGKKSKVLFDKVPARALIFLCIIVAIVLLLNQNLGFADAEHSETIMNEFYEQDKDTVDVVYFGSSATQRGFVVPIAFHDEGVAAYSIACGSQPFILTKYLIEESLKTQTPKVFIVELRGACKGPEDLWDVAVRRVVDNMNFSSTKRDAIQKVMDYSEDYDNGIDETGLSYYFTLFKYHSRWNPSLQPKYLTNVDYYKGYTLDWGVCFRCREISPKVYDEKNIIPIAPETEKALNELLDYCDTLENSKVLFVVSPYEASLKGMGKINYSKNIVESRGYEVLNFISQEAREDLGLNDKTCYYNREHLNYHGSLKYTKYISEYVKENYSVPDRRGDVDYDSWEKQYERLQENLKTTYLEKYEGMMKKVRKTGDN